MIQNPALNSRAKTLRKRAKSLQNALEDEFNNSKTEVLSLIHELQSYQVELEVQNETLRQSQSKLAESRAHYCELFNCVPVAYLTLDHRGVILEANLEATEILRKTHNDILGTSLANYIAPDSLNAYHLHRQAVFRSEQKQTAELVIRTNSEPITTVRIESLARTPKTTGIMRSHSVLIDVSSQKNTELALQAINQNLANEIDERTRLINIRSEELVAILNAATDAIITIDSEGTIETVNPATESMFGYVNDELIGNNISLLMPEPYASAHNQYIRRYLDKGQNRVVGRSTEMTAKRKDNTLFPVSLAISRVDDEPRFTEIIRDMTERVKVEKEVLQSIEDERNRISRELHDTISQTLVGSAMKARSLSDLLGKSGVHLAAPMSEFGHALERAGQEVHAIVKDLAALQLEENRLEDYFLSLVEYCRSYSTAEICLDWQHALAVDDPYLGTQLFRIAQEALHNAIKHANATLISIEASKKSDTIYLSVTDNGVGLSSEHVRNNGVFNLTGLGISNMKYRAHVIGASLEIESGDHGTTVECILAS